MKTIYAERYESPCVVIEPGDIAEDVIIDAMESGATYSEDDEELIICKFPGRCPELYTEKALRTSIPIPRDDELSDDDVAEITAEQDQIDSDKEDRLADYSDSEGP